MYSAVHTASIHGIESIPVTCEADLSDGLPVFDLVGFLSTEVRESRERVRTALKNTGIHLPPKRITINISPASIRKSGTSFDLPIAASILSAMGLIPPDILQRIVLIGELSLYGEVLPVKGVLPIALSMKNREKTILAVPEENAREASLCPELSVLPIRSLREMIRILGSEKDLQNSFFCRLPEEDPAPSENPNSPDFRDLHGQKILRRALEVSASGGHHILLIGPPGSGKTMAAELLPTILPPMTLEERRMLSKIYSVSGLLRSNQKLMEERPFRSPHHTITSAGLAGGGCRPSPGEISLAASGVLFLDELPEFQRQVIENLREPLEKKTITIVRNTESITYPADFLLAAAMNPCPCGYYPDLRKCRCTPPLISRYLRRISQPLLDRIDLTVETQEVSFADLISEEKQESSEEIRKRVIRTRKIQEERFRGLPFYRNSDIPVSLLGRFCILTTEGKRFMEHAFQAEGLTARSFHRTLRVARTIADMEQHEVIEGADIAEAVSYRSMDKKYWGKEVNGMNDAFDFRRGFREGRSS